LLYKIFKYLENIDHFRLAFQLTLLDLILRPIGTLEIRTPLLILAILGLIIPNLIKNYLFWLTLTILTLIRVVLDWPLADNHAYLLTLWCFAIFLSTYKKDSNLLKSNAKLMIGLVFLFAFIWKAFLSSDYLDNRFFSISMIEDPRFSEFTQVTCDISENDLNDFRDYIKQHIDGDLVFVDVINFDFECINKISGFLTYYTLFLEFLVALFFLMPKKIRVSKYRDYFLILFCIFVYSVSTVEGFGCLLLAMGLSQYEEIKIIKLSYLVTFLIILIYREVPIFEIMLKTF